MSVVSFREKSEINAEKYYEALDVVATDFMVNENNFDSFALAIASLKFSFKAFKFYEKQMLDSGQKLPGDFIDFCQNINQCVKEIK